ARRSGTCPSRLPESAPSKTFSFSLSWVVWQKLKRKVSAPGLPVQGSLRLVKQVRDVLLHLGDVVEAVLGAAVQPGERCQADDAGGQPEGGAVHRLGDALREQRRLLRGVDAGDAGERLDEAGDGPQQARQSCQVAEHRQVAGPLLKLRP